MVTALMRWTVHLDVTTGDSGLCCCTCVTYFKRYLTPLRVDFVVTCVVVSVSVR